MTNQELLRMITDVMMGRLGGIVFTGALIVAPILLVCAALASTFGIISPRTYEAAVAAVVVLGMMFFVWLAAFYAVPLFLGDLTDLPIAVQTILVGCALVPVMLVVLAVSVLRRYIRTGSIEPREDG